MREKNDERGKEKRKRKNKKTDFSGCKDFLLFEQTETILASSHSTKTSIVALPIVRTMSEKSILPVNTEIHGIIISSTIEVTIF